MCIVCMLREAPISQKKKKSPLPSLRTPHYVTHASDAMYLYVCMYVYLMPITPPAVSYRVLLALQDKVVRSLRLLSLCTSEAVCSVLRLLPSVPNDMRYWYQ